MVERIVFDRRHMENATLPASNEDNGALSTFHVAQQKDFQNTWNRIIITAFVEFNDYFKSLV